MVTLFFSLQKKNSKIIEEVIQKIIESNFEFLVPIIVKKKEELQVVFDDSVFLEDKKTKSYFILLNQIPDFNLVKHAHAITFENEEFTIVKNCIYFYASKGYGRIKFNINSFKKKLNVNATTRNYNTINKLLALANAF